MNVVSFKSLGRLGSKPLAWFCLTLFPLMAWGTDSIYISPALVGNPAPQVDATNFYNAGTWNIFTYPLRYVTKNTLNYTNKGSMTGAPGWQFDLGSGSTGRKWSANFFNDVNGSIRANDVTVFSGIAQGELIQRIGYLLVSATNIVNKGFMSAGAGGEIVLTGSSVNLNHSGLEITSISGTGSQNDSPTNGVFTPETAIYDDYWEATNTLNLTIGGSPWFPPTLSQFFFSNVMIPCGFFAFVTIGPLNPDVVDYVANARGPYILTTTNADGSLNQFLLYSNLFNQGVFVYTGPNNISGQIRFLPTNDPTNGFDIVAIQLASTSTNVVTAQPQFDTFYLVDSFAASTNHGLNFNFAVNPAAVCGSATYRPAAYSVSRTEPFEFTFGNSPGNGMPPSTFFYDPATFTNLISRGGAFAVYSCLIDNVAAQQGSVSNLPGRVRIYADNLNLNQTHVRAEGQIILQATNLISSANATMDCQNLSFNLASTNGQLNFTNLAPPLVYRFHGTNNMFTVVWTNYMVVLYQNYAFSNIVVPPSTNTILVPYESDITNVTLVHLSLTAMDAGGLQSTATVTNQDLVLHSTNIVVSDSVLVSRSFLLDGLRATLVGNVTFTELLQDWTYVNAPKLRYFTNNATLSIPNNAHFGDDEPTNYLAFVNNGSIIAGGQAINSSNILINSQAINVCTNGGFLGIANMLQLTGTILARSDMQFFANILQLNGAGTLATRGALYLTVTNTLADSGVGSSSRIDCQNGFNLFLKPAKGDLLGTAINSRAPINSVVDHVWAGVDRGVSSSGYVNDAAIGTLALIPAGSQQDGYQPTFAFFGATGTNALYVVNLDLTQLTNYLNEIAIDPSITIYYENVSLNPVVNTGSQTANQLLDGMRFPDADGNPGGYMHWVNVGPVPPRQASYGNITGNYNGANGKLQLMVSSAAGPTNFIIQASVDLKNWVPIYTNSGPFGIYTDPDAGSYSHRFYRTVPGH